MNKKSLIALDVDGVLLDYSTAYAKAWEKAFGQHPVEVNPFAFWPHERWGIPWLEGEQLKHFKAQFDEVFWSTLPALPGAVEACAQLVDAGFELIAVTAIESHWQDARILNLEAHGFRIDRLVATGGALPGRPNPKAAIINELKPVAFVDDYPPYLCDIELDIHTALVRPDHRIWTDSDHSPDARSITPSLLAFVETWLKR